MIQLSCTFVFMIQISYFNNISMYLHFSDGDEDFQKPKKIKLKSPKVCRKVFLQGSGEESAVLKCLVSKSKQHARRRRQERLCPTSLLGRKVGSV